MITQRTALLCRSAYNRRSERCARFLKRAGRSTAAHLRSAQAADLGPARRISPTFPPLLFRAKPIARATKPLVSAASLMRPTPRLVPRAAPAARRSTRGTPHRRDHLQPHTPPFRSRHVVHATKHWHWHRRRRRRAPAIQLRRSRRPRQPRGLPPLARGARHARAACALRHP